MKRFLIIVAIVAVWLAVSWKLREKLLPVPKPDRGPLPHITGPQSPPPDASTHEPAGEPEASSPDGAAPGSDVPSDHDDLQLVRGIGPVYSTKLGEGGITTFDDLVDADSGEIAAKLGVTTDAVDDWKSQAASLRRGSG